MRCIYGCKLLKDPFKDYALAEPIMAYDTVYFTSGFTTKTIPYQGGAFQIDFDFQRHMLIIRSTHHDDITFGLKEMSVADFYRQIISALGKIGLNVEIHKRPNELEDNTPFDEDVKIRPYDAEKVEDFLGSNDKSKLCFYFVSFSIYWKVQSYTSILGAFDLAVTRFSGRSAPLHTGQMPNMPLNVMQEAYSQEVFSVGFWPGSKVFPEPVFYAYCYPSPQDFKTQNIEPKEAFFSEEMGEFF